jgi:hypothetical protein
MEKFFKFTYRAGQPVRSHGKVVLLDKNRNWNLAEGFEYIIDGPVTLELEKCIIIKNAKKFVLVDEIIPTYEVSGGPYVEIEKKEVNFYVKRKLVYQEEVISSETDYKSFTFGLTGSEEFYNLLPEEAKKQVDDFRVWITWISDNQLILLSASSDFLVHRGFRLQSDTKSLKVETSGSGKPEQPKEVYVLRLQKLIYEPVFENGFEPAIVEGSQEVTHTIQTLTLEESGLPFSFRPVWKSPTLMVGKLTVSGEEVEGLVKRPGDGTGSYLDAAMYLGLMELPPATLSENDLTWLDSGGRICWVYKVSYNDITSELMLKFTNPPNDPSGWAKVISVYFEQGMVSVRYIQDSWNNLEYMRLVEESRQRSTK